MFSKETGIKISSKVLEKLLGLSRMQTTLDKFRISSQTEKEYWKILKTKLLKAAFSKMESWMALENLKTKS